MMPGLAHFPSRQAELREKLLWAPLRSARRHRLQAELDALVREELRAEVAPAPARIPSPGEVHRPGYWWQER